MGHARIARTADTYGHVQPERHEAAVEALDVTSLAFAQPGQNRAGVIVIVPDSAIAPGLFDAVTPHASSISGDGARRARRA
jgi:hypothetical protein